MRCIWVILTWPWQFLLVVLQVLAIRYLASKNRRHLNSYNYYYHIFELTAEIFLRGYLADINFILLWSWMCIVHWKSLPLTLRDDDVLTLAFDEWALGIVNCWSRRVSIQASVSLFSEFFAWNWRFNFSLFRKRTFDFFNGFLYLFFFESLLFIHRLLYQVKFVLLEPFWFDLVRSRTRIISSTWFNLSP